MNDRGIAGKTIEREEAAENGFWVFGYGSLMWDPGFEYEERSAALLRGYHRAFCIFSTHYRGTEKRPGLVLGLARGGSCRGIAYRVASDNVDPVRTYLFDREMPRYVYRERILPVRVGDRTVKAMAYVADWTQDGYAGDLGVEETLSYIRQGHGERGTNVDYLVNTVRHLEELGIREGKLHELMERLMGEG